ncbi:ABC transporter permease subunit [Agrobacterium larrymoorei]|uniref:ABC transporter permease subunit n=1 Tax=Agrobacterium larrymoorei TaxID=160699 RepID=UPI001574E085|nr:ABC transporter permease subunit [Agrobacterium larrymoorei]NTJ44893.1 ABC transporter permease subunit [Agrobacterium larrymoorei]
MTILADALPATIEEENHAATEQPAAPRSRLRIPTFAISILTGLALVGTWWIASAFSVVSPVFLPAPPVVAASFGTLLTTGFVDSTLVEHLLASLGRVVTALAVSLALGIPVGLLIALSRVGRGVLDPIVEFLRPLPPLAYLPLIIIWIGIGEASKITVIALSMLPPIILSTSAGVRAVPRDFVNAARAFGATRRQVIARVLLPAYVPSILTGIRIALGTGWSTLVAAELVAATRGLGFMIQSAAQFLVTDIVIAGIAVIAIVAIALEWLARFI